MKLIQSKLFIIYLIAILSLAKGWAVDYPPEVIALDDIAEISTDSEESDGLVKNFIDGNPSTIWHSEWRRGVPAAPHWVNVVLKETETLRGVIYLPRKDSENGRILSYKIFVSRRPIRPENPGTPILTGTWKNEYREQIGAFPQAVSGRYILLVVDEGAKDKNIASGAELAFYTSLPRKVTIFTDPDEPVKTKSKYPDWVLTSADYNQLRTDSEEDDASVWNLVDGNPATIWHTQWKKSSPPNPHWVLMELAALQNLKGAVYLPRQDMDNGRIIRYAIYASKRVIDPQNPGEAIARGTWISGKEEQQVIFTNTIQARYVLLRALSSVNNSAFASGAELALLTESPMGEKIFSVRPKDYSLDLSKPGPWSVFSLGKVIKSASGKSILQADSTGSGEEWNEFFTTEVGSIPADSAVTISFAVGIKTENDESSGYLLVRSRSNPSDVKLWASFGDQELRQQNAVSITGGAKDYVLVAGIKNKAIMTLSDISIVAKPRDITETVLQKVAKSVNSPGNTTYFVDSFNGNDTNNGIRRATPWKTLAPVNRMNFGAGDRILFVRGGVWNGMLTPGGSGKAGNPIRIAAYGAGPRPLIMAEEIDMATLLLENQEYWEISGLEIMNKGRNEDVLGSLRRGIYIIGQNYGSIKHIYLSNLIVRDVNGGVIKSSGRSGNGILAQIKGGDKKSWFDDFRVEGCEIFRVDRNAIATETSYWSRKDWCPSSNVIFRNNRIYDIGGDGIIPYGCDGALVEYNVVSDCHKRSGKYIGEASVAIWPWSSDNTLIQFNEAYNTRFTVDGQGFDSDWNCSNSIFQYNYSHHNEGGFILICNDGSSKPEYNIGNVGTIVRYNISQNDGHTTFHFAGPSRDTQIYNNTIYADTPTLKHPVKFSSWGGWATNTFFYNNIFYDLTDATYLFGKDHNTLFSHNLFFGKEKQLPKDDNKITKDPRLLQPGSGGKGIDSVGGYRLLSGSPCLGSGKVIKNNGGRDYFGNLVSTEKPSRGACELSEDQFTYLSPQPSFRPVGSDSELPTGMTYFNANDPRILIQGRVKRTPLGEPILTWPGVSFTVRFSGTSPNTRFGFVMRATGGDPKTTANYFQIIIDGEPKAIVGYEKEGYFYYETPKLSAGEHRITVFKRTEATPNSITLVKVGVDSGSTLLTPPPLPQRKIEFYGDSITCGLGNEAPPKGDEYFKSEQNNYMAYGAIASRALFADYRAISISGVALLHGWDRKTEGEGTLLRHWEKTDRFDTVSDHDFTSWVPDIVVINLLQNDYWCKPLFSLDYVSAYKSFLKSIRAKYPSSIIICALGPMDVVLNSTWTGYVADAVNSLGDSNIHTLAFPFADGGHPRLETHQQMALLLAEKIKQLTGW